MADSTLCTESSYLQAFADWLIENEMADRPCYHLDLGTGACAGLSDLPLTKVAGLPTLARPAAVGRPRSVRLPHEARSWSVVS